MKEMAFDPTRCIVIIQTYPTGQAHMDISAMLHAKGFPLENARFVNLRDTIAARNFAVREHILPSKLPHALLIDADMTPGPQMDRLWRSKADIAGPYYDTGNDASWAGGFVHCGMMRINTEVFRTLPPPWFLIDRSPDGCDVLACECLHFCRRAKAVGFTIKQAGYCGHAKPHGCSAPY